MKNNKGSDRDVVVRKKGFSILSFILGILIGIIILAGAVFGVGYFAATSDLNSVLGMFGVQNKDENGNETIVNTNPDTGGARNAIDLISRLMELVGKGDAMTIGEIEGIVPAASGFVTAITGSFEEYVELDETELKNTAFKDLGTYLEDVMLDVQPAVLMDKMGTHGTMNRILELVLYGAEASYVSDPAGARYPVYADKYVKDAESDVWKRDGDNRELPAEMNDYIVYDNVDKAYYIYHFEYGPGYYINGVKHTSFITVPDGANYPFTCVDDVSAAKYSYDALYNAECTSPTGNYYKDVNDEKVVISPITLRTLTEGGDAFEPLNKVYLTELMDENDPDSLVSQILGDVTLGQVMNGGLTDMDDRVNALELSNLLTIDTSAILAYFGYGLTGLEPIEEEATGSIKRYTATYNPLPSGGEEDDPSGGDTSGKPTEKVKALVEAEAIADGSYRILKVYRYNAEAADFKGEPIQGTTVGEVSDRVDGVTRDIRIGDLMTIGDDNTILKSIENSTVESLPDDIAALSVNELYASEIYRATETKMVDGVPVETTYEAQLRPVTNATVAEEDYYTSAKVHFDKSYLYYEYVDGAYKLVNAGSDNAGKLESLSNEDDEAGRYFTYGRPNKLWKLLVIERTETEGEPAPTVTTSEKAYSVNSIPSMIDNVTDNIENSTLNELNDAGILTFSNPEDLNIVIPDKEGKTLGELPLTDALSELIGLLNKLPAMG